MWAIRNVDSYRCFAATGRQLRGTVCNMATGEPRRFETKAAAQSYAQLSQMRDVRIEDDDAL